jgi:hypothetical protein
MTKAAHLAHITHFQIVSDPDPEKLQTRVEAAIHDGWQPFGSLAVDRWDSGVSYIQPMVQYAEWYR